MYVYIYMYIYLSVLLGFKTSLLVSLNSKWTSENLKTLGIQNLRDSSENKHIELFILVQVH